MGEFEGPGDNNTGASCCWNEKAGICPLFVARQSKKTLEAEFDRMPVSELVIRWPSIGELIKIEALVQSLEDEEEDDDPEHVREPEPRRSRNEIPSSDGVNSERVLRNDESGPSLPEEEKNSGQKDRRTDSGSPEDGVSKPA
jgi:hypothetical protein